MKAPALESAEKYDEKAVDIYIDMDDVDVEVKEAWSYVREAISYYRLHIEQQDRLLRARFPKWIMFLWGLLPKTKKETWE